MRCPVCQKALLKFQVPHRGFYHRCNDHGVYASELFLKLTPHGPQILKDLKQPGVLPQPPVPCVYCFKPMPQKTILNQVQVENCQRCKMVWFDFGEVEVVQSETLPQAPAPARKPENYEWESNSLRFQQMMATGAPGMQDNRHYAESGLETKAKLGMVTVTLIALSIVGQLILRQAYKRGDLASSIFIFRPDLGLWANKFRILASGFAHISAAHCLINMYFLWIFMNDIEEDDGPELGFLLFIGGVIAGNIFYYLSGHQSPSLGATSGMFAAMTYFVLRYPERRFHLVFGHRNSRYNSRSNHNDLYYDSNRWRVPPQIITMPAWLFFGAFIIVTAFLARLQYDIPMDGIVNPISHMGGVGVGLLVYLWKSSKKPQVSGQ